MFAKEVLRARIYLILIYFFLPLLSILYYYNSSQKTRSSASRKRSLIIHDKMLHSKRARGVRSLFLSSPFKLPSHVLIIGFEAQADSGFTPDLDRLDLTHPRPPTDMWTTFKI